MLHQGIQQIRTNLYIDFLLRLSLEDASLQDVVDDILLASFLASNTEESIGGASRQQQDTFSEQELVIYGTPSRYQLKPSTKQRLLAEFQSTLATIADAFYGDAIQRAPQKEGERGLSLPNAIVTFKDDVETLRSEARATIFGLTEMTDRIKENSIGLARELKQAIVTTFPAYNDARSADIDLLAATLESSLIRLSLAHARSERAIYHYQPTQESRNVAQALSLASLELKKEETRMRKEMDTLDRQLKEYETMLQLVDGGYGGYQQIVNDWTKVKQETQECLRDLRRLGWTGD